MSDDLLPDPDPATDKTIDEWLQRDAVALRIGELASDLRGIDRTVEEAGEMLGHIYSAGFVAGFTEAAARLERLAGVPLPLAIDVDLPTTRPIAEPDDDGG